MLANFVGFMLFFIGLFVTASFVLLPLYFIYKKVIGFEETPEALIIENRLILITEQGFIQEYRESVLA